VERARTSYGVVINALDPDVLHYEVDQAATSKLRSEMRKNHLP
jgi:N-methylhydantoinase B